MEKATTAKAAQSLDDFDIEEFNKQLNARCAEKLYQSLPDRLYAQFFRTQRTMKDFEAIAKEYLEECKKSANTQYFQFKEEALQEIERHPIGITQYFLSRLPKEFDGLKSILLDEQRKRRDSITAPPPQQQAATVVKDNRGNIIGVVIHDKFQWLCSKADMGKILVHLQQTELQTYTTKDLIQRAINFFPDVAKSPNNAESIKSAIKDANKPERTSTTIDIETASKAVLQYIR